MQKLFAATLLLLCLGQTLAHKGYVHNCIHDDIEHKIEFEYNHIEKEKIARRDLGTTTYAPIRIKARFDNLTGIPQDQYTFITTKLIPNVISFLSTALSVVPVTSKLTFGSGVCSSAPIPANLTTVGESADIVLLVTAFTTDPGLLAWASPCRIAGDGRPILGQVNFNPTAISADPASYNDQFATLRHEITHALGFSAALFSYFNTGAPVGQAKTVTTVNNRGNTGYAINTTRVVNVARKHFGCNNITSVELENEGGSATIGTHWERRILGNEGMTGSAIANAKYSHFTLALLEDSGWYKANYSVADSFSYGYQSGCPFIYQQCINKDTKKSRFPQQFCDTPSAGSCTVDGSAKGVCAVNSGSSSKFNYFGDNSTGFDGLSDECPTILPYSNGNCQDTTQTNAYYLPEKYGAGSKCFSGTLLDNRYSSSNTFFGCYPSSCRALNGVTRLYVTLGSNEYLCPQGGGQITNVSGYNGYLTCPSETQYCPSTNSTPIINPNTA